MRGVYLFYLAFSAKEKHNLILRGPHVLCMVHMNHIMELAYTKRLGIGKAIFTSSSGCLVCS